MTDRDLMHQALDALETVFMPHHPAVIALRDRLAQPEQTLTCVCGAVWEGELMVHAPRDRLAQPEVALQYPQDAVEWQKQQQLRAQQINAQSSGYAPRPWVGLDALETVYKIIIDWDECGGKRSRRELARRIVDLYTNPRRPWVGLTDEPMAWMFQHEETGRTMCVDAQQLESGFEKGNPRLKKIAPLYTNPRRQWVGLTDEELIELSESGLHLWGLWRAIEAKLKEKNT